MARHRLQREDSSVLPSITPRQSSPLNILKVNDKLPFLPRGSPDPVKNVLDAAEGIEEVHTTPPSRNGTPGDAEGWDTVDNITALGLAFGYCNTPVKISPIKKRFVLEELELKDKPAKIQPARPPFEKWVRSLNRKATLRHREADSTAKTGAPDGDFYSLQSRELTRQRLRKSTSGSSLGFVTALKSASISLASFSIATKSRNLGHTSKHQKTERSSRASNLGPRASEDSAYVARGIANDVAVTNRSIRRRRVLEEIISTEEGYVGDIKFLMNVSV
jgi:hypothetical protein